MKQRTILTLAATAGLLVGACSSSAATVAPTTAPATAGAPSVAPTSETSAAPSASAASTGGPSANLPQSIGKGEGSLNIIVWAGYAEDGSNVKQYDWVHPFEAANPDCGTVNVKPAGTSDEMVSLMRQGNGKVYDGVSASGDATKRLIANGDVAEINVNLLPDFPDIAPFLQSPAHNTIDGKHYGVSHGWGGNVLMYRTDQVTPAPTSWGVVFDPVQSKPYQGKITDYDSPIYIADAALYLKTANPALGITDPYELTQPQFDAAVALLKTQQPWISNYWSLLTSQIQDFTNGASVVGTTWPYQVNTLKAAGVKVEAVVPSEGMTGWADTWMLSSHAQHPNCMYKWMAWMITPQVQAEVAESFGEAPANPKACSILDVGYGPYAVKDFCTVYHVNDQAFYGAISFWKTPQADCGDSRGTTCVDYTQWSSAWTSIKG
jgi:putative spermidine/putrescine transport system substrate-binding protein